MEEPKKNSVLVVDDESSNITALTHILSPAYTVYVAKNGRNAIDAANKHSPDIILLDIVMPEMDGYTVIAELKGSERTQNIPVIFITGLSDPGDEEKGLSLGAADYISKPFSSAIVKLRVQNQIQIINQTRTIIEKETAAKSLRTRSEFLSRMSHEMRTPMNAIMGLSVLAKTTADSAKRDDMLGKINAASGQLLKLIDDVLEMSDIEEKKLRLTCSEFSFVDMLDNILTQAGPEIRKKQQSLAVETDPSIPAALFGDPRLLSQVISNLLSNAIKFTPEQGSLQIIASVLNEEDGAVTLQIIVIDNGIGMTPEQLDRLFIPFEQADGGVDRKFGGAGLGLAISNYIVGLMGGEFRVESAPGKGSKIAFTVRMPTMASMSAMVSMPTMVAMPATASLEGKTVLLADDVDVNREIVIAMLEDTGLLIECAENGREAFDMFSASPGKYDVILMDVNMPVMDGVEATRRIRALDAPEAAQVPIIAMTANVLMSEVETYLADGMTDHIGKPIDFDRLRDMLYRHIRIIAD